MHMTVNLLSGGNLSLSLQFYDGCMCKHWVVNWIKATFHHSLLNLYGVHRCKGPLADSSANKLQGEKKINVLPIDVVQ